MSVQGLKIDDGFGFICRLCSKRETFQVIVNGQPPICYKCYREAAEEVEVEVEEEPE